MLMLLVSAVLVQGISLSPAARQLTQEVGEDYYYYYEDSGESESSILELAVATPALSTLVTVLTMPAYAPVLTALSGNGPFTVFAPTDEAFAKAGVNVNDVATVTEVLKYHVVSGAITSSVLQSAQLVASLQGEEIYITKNSEGVYLNGDVNGGAKVLIADVMASNGVVHVVDAVIMPPSVLSAASAAKATPMSIVELAVGAPVLSTLVAVSLTPPIT
jgi:transforming growth factor-beta-induced protein